MNKKILNSNLLIPMIVFVFLSMSATLVLAGTDNCKIKSGHPDESAEYCPTCEADGIPAKVSCETGPTKGVSGCGCADSWCAKWIENDTCDWSDGVKVCKVVCGDTSDMPICSQVLRNPGAQGLLGITYPSFNLQIIDYLPLGGCPCTSDADCQVNGKYPHRYCQREKFECAELNCNGLLEPRLACCSETGYDCAVDSDCCSLQAVCTNGTCRATQTAICTSTDGPGPSQNPYGDDPFTPGTTSGTTYLMPCVQKDSCSSGKLIEWYCQQNNPNCLSKTIDCNTVCGS